MKVCVIKTSSMGDVIHTLPALTDAQRAIPHLYIDWVVEENFAEIPRWHSAVNQIIPISLRRWRKSPFSAQTKNEWKSYRTLLQANQYDTVIDAQGLFTSPAGRGKGQVAVAATCSVGFAHEMNAEMKAYVTVV